MSIDCDRARIRAAFERAAVRYDSAAVLQREIGDRLLERLELMKIAPRQVLEVGSGTGYCSRSLLERYPGARFLALDLAHAMLGKTRRRFGRWQRWRRRPAFVCGDAATLPLADASVDLIFSNVTLQWCHDPAQVFAGFHRVLRPGGLLLFSTFGPDTLAELRAAWQAVDDRPHVNTFFDMHDLGDALLRCGFADPVMDREDLVLTYSHARGLLQDLKTLGAHTVRQPEEVAAGDDSVGRATGRGLSGRQQLQAMYRAYERFRREDGRLPASYEVIYGHAWRVERPPAAAGPEQHISFDSLQQALRQRD